MKSIKATTIEKYLKPLFPKSWEYMEDLNILPYGEYEFVWAGDSAIQYMVV